MNARAGFAHLREQLTGEEAETFLKYVSGYNFIQETAGLLSDEPSVFTTKGTSEIDYALAKQIATILQTYLADGVSADSDLSIFEENRAARKLGCIKVDVTALDRDTVEQLNNKAGEIKQKIETIKQLYSQQQRINADRDEANAQRARVEEAGRGRAERNADELKNSPLGGVIQREIDKRIGKSVTEKIAGTAAKVHEGQTR